MQQVGLDTFAGHAAPKAEAVKRDPAPSRLLYRYERMILTPLFRFIMRVVVPFCVGVLAVQLYFADQERSDRFFMLLNDLRTSFVERPEFMVHAMAIDGASPSLAGDIREVLPVDFPISSFDLDLPTMRLTVMGLSPVKAAELRIGSGGIMQVVVEERTPVLRWRLADGVHLVDAEGFVVATGAENSAYRHLPLIAGEGADAQAVEALSLLKAAAPLGDRLRGLVRVGARRWDVILDRDQRIMLPERGARQALERVVAMSQVQDLLDRDLAIIDMRLADRPTLRIADRSVETWWQVRQSYQGAGE